MDVRKVYQDYAARGQDSAQQLGWNDAETQARHMKVALSLLERGSKALKLDPRTLLVHDAGCGHGDFITYFEQLKGGPSVASYIGTDLLPESVAEAQKRHPGYHFFTRNLVREDVPPADVTVCLGALAFHSAPNTVRLLNRLWDATKHVLVFNAWWDLTPSYKHYWEAGKAQKRIQQWLTGKKHIVQGGYEKTERMFLVVRPVVEARP